MSTSAPTSPAAAGAMKSGSMSAAVLLAFASIYIIWGTTYLAIAVAIRTIPPFVSGGIRYTLAGALMYAWLRTKGPNVFAGVNLPQVALVGVLLSGIGNGFVVWAQQGIPTGVAALIVCSVPVLVLVLDWILFTRKAPSPQGLVGIAIALAGVVVIVTHTHELSGAARPMYLISLIVATIGWSFGTLLQKRSATAATVLSFTCAQMFVGGLFQLSMATVDNEWVRFDPGAVSIASLLALGYLIVFGSIVTLNAYLWLLTRVSAQKVTTYALVNPVVAMLLGAVFLQEKITTLAITAAVLVLVGVALVLFQNLNPTRMWRDRKARAAA